MDKKRNGWTKSLLWISETTGLSAQAAIHALALEKEAEKQAQSPDGHDNAANVTASDLGNGTEEQDLGDADPDNALKT